MNTSNLYLSLVIAVSILGSLPILEKITLQKMDVTQMIFYRSLSQTILMGLVVWFGTTTPVNSLPPLKYIGFALLQGVAITVMLFFYLSAINTSDVSFVNPAVAAAPLITYTLAVLVLHEPLTIVRLSGVILIVGGVILILSSK